MNVLMTGATGYIGKHILADLLKRGLNVAVIVRGKNGLEGKRVLDALAPFRLHSDLLGRSRLKVFFGDISRGRCGLSEGDLSMLAQMNIGCFLHCAGLTRFDEHLAGDIFQHNLQGVKNAWETANQLKIKRFRHLSTAFVLGCSNKVFSSRDLDVGQSFNNPYEASKFEAEQFLRRRAESYGGEIHIYRPSIVVGGHALGENNTVSTIYLSGMVSRRRKYRRQDDYVECAGT